LKKLEKRFQFFLAPPLLLLQVLKQPGHPKKGGDEIAIISWIARVFEAPEENLNNLLLIIQLSRRTWRN
jgi:hypothetical protein